MNEDQAPRTNRDGHPCPPWCVTDHDRLHETHMGAVAGIEDPRITARPVHGGGEDNTPQVLVSGGSHPGPDLLIKPRDAEDLAGLVEILAHATPDQHRELAAAIRKASADITGETGEKP